MFLSAVMPEEAVALKTQLMKMEETQNQNYNCENISNTPLDELIQELLKNQDRNQTRLTERKTQFLSDPSGGEYVIIMLKVKNAVPKRVPELPQSTIDDVYIESGWQKLL
jgi:ABC-type proline/glycine betaine transport system ATPase subunit